MKLVYTRKLQLKQNLETNPKYIDVVLISI